MVKMIMFQYCRINVKFTMVCFDRISHSLKVIAQIVLFGVKVFRCKNNEHTFVLVRWALPVLELEFTLYDILVLVLHVFTIFVSY